MRVAKLMREKQTFINPAEAMSEKCRMLKEQTRRYKQEVIALESMLDRVKPKGRKSSRRGAWTKDNDNSSIYQYKGIKLQLDLIANKEACLVVTESTSSRNNIARVRDWTN